MSEQLLLGCPHCGKPIAYAAQLAGKQAACPHCRGPFTMPPTPPLPAAPAVAHPPPPASKKRTTAELTFEPDAPLNLVSPRPDRHEPNCYKNAEKWSAVAAICGCLLAVILGATIVIEVVLTLFQQPGVKSFVLAMVWILGALTTAVGGCAGSLMVRSAVLVMVDAARRGHSK